MNLDALINFAVEQGASDLHLQATAAPMLRIAGQIREIKSDALSADDMIDMLSRMLPPGRVDDIPAAAVKGFDFSYVHSPTMRFRCSAYNALGRPGLVMRVIRTQIPTVEQLHLPKVVADIALAQRGLTLVTGTTGSGKSTTLAAMIDLINENLRCKIITIEDPIEYVHVNKRSLVSQLEVGTDTTSFDQALRQALRQDPDV